MAVLGLDVGTSGSRCVVVDPGGRVLGAATSEHEAFSSPEIGWAEQQPEDWWRASLEAIRKALLASNLNGRSIDAIGLSGQMHGAVLLDDADHVVRPSIIWCDQRTEAECRWLTETIGQRRLLECTSNPALTNFTLPKLIWVRTHEPAAWGRVRHVLLPKDFIRLRLSGEHATDVADASGTLMLDVAHRRWSQEVLDAAGIDRAILPGVFESPDICARVSRQGASQSGLHEGTPIVAGAGDQAAGAVGMGITRPGSVGATIGTSGVVFAATDQPVLDGEGRVHTFCHAVPGRWHVMGVTQAAGLSLSWLRERFAPGVAKDDAYGLLIDDAAAIAPARTNPLWAPYLMGERTPHLDPNIRAALVGLDATHTRGHIVRAVLEGVAFSLRDSFTIIEALGVPVHRVYLSGGGARSSLWRQIQADVYGRAVETVASDEGAAFGAALLAGVGAGLWPGVDDACDQAVQSSVAARPDPKSAELVNHRYAAYRSIYPAIRTISF